MAKIEWQPMHTAPKDRRILLSYGDNAVMGQWSDDRYAKKPRPYWTNDLKAYWGMIRLRETQPIAWAEINLEIGNA